MDETWSVLQKLDKEWSAAIVKNDAHAIGQFMADD
jgi:ketosteroid isomerase-like protein